MSILSGEEPLIDRLMRAYRGMPSPSEGTLAALGGVPLPGVPVVPAQTDATRVGIPSVPQTPPISPTAGPPPRIDDSSTPLPTAPAPIVSPPSASRPTYEYPGLGTPFTNPVTVGPDPRQDLQSEAGLAWLAKVNPQITNTPAGPAVSTISTLRGGTPGLSAFYSPDQMAAQQSRGINLIGGGGGFNWDAGNTAQLNSALGARAAAASQAQYLERKGQAEIEMARAAEEAKLAKFDPARMQTMMLLKAAEINPGLWTQPEFKQKVCVPLSPADKLAMLQGEHPGLDIAGGVEQIGAGYAPGTPRIAQMLDASRFGMAPLTPREKVEQALASIPPNRAEEWRRVAEVMGLINPITGTRAR